MTAVTSPSSRPHLRASLAVAACGAMWGTFWIPLRWLDAHGLGGAWVSVVFFAVAAVAPLPLMTRRDAWAGLSRQLVNGSLMGAAFALYTVALVLTDVIDAILLFYLTPVWSTLAGLFFLRERLTWSRALAMLLGFSGMTFILGFDAGLPMPRNPGDWIALVSGMLWAAGTLLSFRRPSERIALPVFAFCLGGLVSSLAVVAAAAASGSAIATLSNLPVTLPWGVIFALIFFVPPNFLVLWAAQRIDSGRIGILLMTEVMAGSLTAALFSGEPYGLMELTGTLLIVCAGLVEVLGRR